MASGPESRETGPSSEQEDFLFGDISPFDSPLIFSLMVSQVIFVHFPWFLVYLPYDGPSDYHRSFYSFVLFSFPPSHVYTFSVISFTSVLYIHFSTSFIFLCDNSRMCVEFVKAPVRRPSGSSNV